MSHLIIVGFLFLAIGVSSGLLAAFIADIKEYLKRSPLVDDDRKILHFRVKLAILLVCLGILFCLCGAISGI